MLAVASIHISLGATYVVSLLLPLKGKKPVAIKSEINSFVILFIFV
jgi:hypothetical protein